MTTAFINVEEIKWQGDECIVYDMSGQGRYRESWSFFYPDIDGIIYCIDSSEEECEDRGTINQEILHEIARHPGLARRNIPIAIMANKQDVDKAYDAGRIAKMINLDELRGINPFLSWSITET